MGKWREKHSRFPLTLGTRAHLVEGGGGRLARKGKGRGSPRRTRIPRRRRRRDTGRIYAGRGSKSALAPAAAVPPWPADAAITRIVCARGPA